MKREELPKAEGVVGSIRDDLWWCMRWRWCNIVWGPGVGELVFSGHPTFSIRRAFLRPQMAPNYARLTDVNISFWIQLHDLVFRASPSSPLTASEIFIVSL